MNENISKVVKLSKKDFKADKLTKPPKIGGMILFKMSWCHHCKDFLPIYQEISAYLDKIYDFYSVEPDDYLVDKFKLKYFPTLKFVDKNGKIYKEYKGNRNALDIISQMNKEFN